MGTTPNFGWIRIATGEDPTQNSNQFFDQDRADMDAIVGSMIGHVHDGASSADASPTLAPNLALISDGSGLIPAGRRVRYRYSLVDANGLETAASPEAFVDTPAPISEPGAPAGISFLNTGGTLLPGYYYYRLSAYVGQNTIETKPSQPATISVTPGTATNQISFNLPSLPAGADGFNVYRRKPGGDYAYLASIDMTVATPPTSFTDDGSITDDCVRYLPKTNITGGKNAVEVALPGATPFVPVGYTWRLYRTYTSGDWSNSFVASVVEETSEGSGIVTPEYLDLGTGALGGEPRDAALNIDNPDPIQLTDGAHTQGILPPAFHVQTYVETFTFPGPLEAIEGTFQVPFVHDVGWIREVWVNLGIDSQPVVDDVEADVLKLDNQLATPTWASIYPTSPKPTVLAGDSYGDVTIPDTRLFVKGDYIAVEILQVGGGATPLDYDLVIRIVFEVVDTTATTTNVAFL